MSRLYIQHSSDMGKGSAHRAHQSATASIRWGSRWDSKLIASINVTWEKGKDKPEVFINPGQEIKLTNAKSLENFCKQILKGGN